MKRGGKNDTSSRYKCVFLGAARYQGEFKGSSSLSCDFLPGAWTSLHAGKPCLTLQIEGTLSMLLSIDSLWDSGRQGLKVVYRVLIGLPGSEVKESNT